jgi:hypothetical protein
VTDVPGEFASLMVTLAAAYPNARLSEAQVRVYYAALRDLPLADVRRACLRAVQECAFLPTIAELRRGIVPPTDEAALLAWTALNRAVGLIGGYQSLELADGCAAAALRRVFGSWPQFCEEPAGPGLALKQREYFAAYKQSRRTASVSGPPTRLPGLSEASGRYQRKGPVWVGLIAADGTVQPARERAQLTSHKETPQLKGDTDGSAR